MAKNSVNQWSTSASANTDIGGISILGTANVSNFDDALRELMAQIRNDMPILSVARTFTASQTISTEIPTLTLDDTTTAGVEHRVYGGGAGGAETLTLSADHNSVGAGSAVVLQTGGSVVARFDGSANTLNGSISISGGVTLGSPLPISSGGTGSSTASGARTNLGLGSAATQNTGTSGSNVPLMSGANTWGATQTISSAIPTLVLDDTTTAGAEHRIYGGGAGGSEVLTLSADHGNASGNSAVVLMVDGAEVARFTAAGLVLAGSGVVPVASGGTGSTTASGARTNLGTNDAANLTTGYVPVARLPHMSGTEGATAGFVYINNDSSNSSNLGSLRLSGLGAFSYVYNGSTKFAVGIDGVMSGVSIPASLLTGLLINNSNWSGTELAVANGGTGATTATSARTNLGINSTLIGSLYGAIAATSVGQIIMAKRVGTSGYAAGDTITGSALVLSNASGTDDGTTVSGTWQCQGYIAASSSGAAATTNWKRTI